VEKGRLRHFLGGDDGLRRELWIDGENVEYSDSASEFVISFEEGGGRGFFLGVVRG